MCSSAWSMDTRSIGSASCCRGTGSLRSLSRPEGMCKLSTLTVVLELLSCLTAKHANSCEIARNAVIPIMARPAALTSARRDRQQVAEWGSGAQSECQIFAPEQQAVLLLHRRSADAQTRG